MWRQFILAVPLLALALPANAAHCPHGQIWRVHLSTCVSHRSALAHISIRHHHHVRFVRWVDPVEDRVVDPPAEPDPVIPYRLPGSRMFDYRPPQFWGP